MSQLFQRQQKKVDAKKHSFRILTSSKSTIWTTPPHWFDYLNLEFGFTLDPCAESSTAKCRRYYTPEENGLLQSWKDERVFVNPPYGRAISLWMQKSYEEARDNGALVVCLVPVRTGSRWWHNYAAKGEIRFPIGRLQFGGATTSAPFDSAIVIFRPRPQT